MKINDTEKESIPSCQGNISSDTLKNGKAPDRCPYCGIRFENPVELIQHVFRYHST